MIQLQTVVRFRADADAYNKAQERVQKKGVTLPDVLRAALSAIATGDITQFSDVTRDATTPGDFNNSWLYHKCMETFEYRDGFLYRKLDRGHGKAGERAVIRTIEGIDTVVVQGTNYPLKDIVWLMAHGTLNGEVTYRNPYRNANGKHLLENLRIKQGDAAPVVVTVHISVFEREQIKDGKQRAVVIRTSGDAGEELAMKQLMESEKRVSLALRTSDGTQFIRTGLHAIQMEKGVYVVSIS